MCVWDRCVGPGLGPVAAGPAVADVCGLLGAAVQRAKVCGLYDHILVDCQGKRLPWQSKRKMATGPGFVGYGHLYAKLTKTVFRVSCRQTCQFHTTRTPTFQHQGPAAADTHRLLTPVPPGQNPPKLPITTFLTPTGRLPPIREIGVHPGDFTTRPGAQPARKHQNKDYSKPRSCYMLSKHVHRHFPQ